MKKSPERGGWGKGITRKGAGWAEAAYGIKKTFPPHN